MSDFETFVGMLRRRQIPHRIEDGTVTITPRDDVPLHRRTGEKVDGDPGRVHGYTGFFTAFSFDDDDALCTVGVWE